MESINPNTRTYTAPTCTLLVTTKVIPPNLDELQNPPAIDFTLHLDHPEQGESERITLNGNPQQLDSLQQSVSQYVSELVATVPLPMTDSDNLSPAEQPGIDAPGGRLLLLTQRLRQRVDEAGADSLDRGTEEQSPQLGLMQNLPGLRSGFVQPNPEPKTDAPVVNPLSTQNISKLLGRWSSDNDGGNQANRKPQEDLPPTTPTDLPIPTTAVNAYLTAGDCAIDHKLHLGDLATPSSGEILTLSVIQLFDLSTILDEYAAVTSPSPLAAAPISASDTPDTELTPTTASAIYRKGIGASTPTSSPATDSVVPVSSAISRLPNLPNLPNLAVAPQETIQVYDYANGGGRPFASVVPWAAAAALAVGLPLILFGSKSNSLKELTASVKLPDLKAPDLDAAKKSVMSRLPGQEPATSSPETSTGATPETSTGATPANLPKPWEQQAIQPPQTQTSPTVPGAQMPVNPDKIGIAPLPPTIMGTAQGAQTQAPSVSGAAKPGANKPLPAAIASAPALNSLSGIAPNPLNAPSIQTNTPSIPTAAPSIPTAAPSTVTTQPTRPKLNNPVTNLPVSPVKIAKATKVSNPTGKINPGIGKINPGKVSIAKKMPVMPPNISVGITNIGSVVTPVPFSPAETPVAPRIDPSPFKPLVQKKASKPKAKPTAIATKPKTASIKPTSPFMTPKPSFEPFTPDPNSNPNIINPVPPTSSEGAEVQNPPIVAEPKIQSNVGLNPANPDPFDSPSLQETKRYFQGKWQADPTQPNPLQYVVQVSGKSGVVRSVNPQGEAATEYLKKTSLLKPGQKLVSPAAAGNNDQKIRVLLQPDGNVDAFVEP